MVLIKMYLHWGLLQGLAPLMPLPRASASRSRPVELLHLVSSQSACANNRLTGLMHCSFLGEHREARP